MGNRSLSRVEDQKLAILTLEAVATLDGNLEKRERRLFEEACETAGLDPGVHLLMAERFLSLVLNGESLPDSANNYIAA